MAKLSQTHDKFPPHVPPSYAGLFHDRRRSATLSRIFEPPQEGLGRRGEARALLKQELAVTDRYKLLQSNKSKLVVMLQY